MNIKKLAVLFVAVFVTVFVTDFLIHGLVLKGTYQATQSLWRPEAEMHSYMPLMMLGKALTAFFFAWIFVHGYKGTGIGEGIRYGLLIAAFMAGHSLTMHSVAPYPVELTALWVGMAFVQYVVVGVVCSLVYKKA